MFLTEMGNSPQNRSFWPSFLLTDSILRLYSVKNQVDSWPGLPHYFWLFPQLESSEKFHARVADGVKWIVLLMEENV